jgi:hypothetical protein
VPLVHTKFSGKFRPSYVVDDCPGDSLGRYYIYMYTIPVRNIIKKLLSPMPPHHSNAGWRGHKSPVRDISTLRWPVFLSVKDVLTLQGIIRAAIL